MTAPRVLILACGALARELKDVARLHQLDGVTIECLPASLHNTPAAIPGAIRARLARARGTHDRILIGYADCGTAGEIDDICAETGAERLPGAHCYAFFAGVDRFTAMHDAEPGTFYLTDYLARHFDRLVLDGLGINEHPELLELYFGNYTRLVLLAQTDDPEIDRRARRAAANLGLAFDRVDAGLGDLESAVVEFVTRSPEPTP